jgi:hypothetical protein
MTQQEIQECLIIISIMVVAFIIIGYGVKKMKDDIFNGDEL